MSRFADGQANPFPRFLSTLDALHLSTALAIRADEKIDLLLTHDLQMGTAARSLGFEVVGTVP